MSTQEIGPDVFVNREPIRALVRLGEYAKEKGDDAAYWHATIIDPIEEVLTAAIGISFADFLK